MKSNTQKKQNTFSNENQMQLWTLWKRWKVNWQTFYPIFLANRIEHASHKWIAAIAFNCDCSLFIVCNRSSFIYFFFLFLFFATFFPLSISSPTKFLFVAVLFLLQSFALEKSRNFSILHSSMTQYFLFLVWLLFVTFCQLIIHVGNNQTISFRSRDPKSFSISVKYTSFVYPQTQLFLFRLELTVNRPLPPSLLPLEWWNTQYACRIPRKRIIRFTIYGIILFFLLSAAKSNLLFFSIIIDSFPLCFELWVLVLRHLLIFSPYMDGIGRTVTQMIAGVNFISNKFTF